MRLLQIQYFLTIADTGSITKAAQQLYISQPALSKQMNLLEEELGAVLMHRQARGIVLTSAGEQFARDLRKIMTDLDAAVQKVSDLSRMQVLRIGCFDGAVVEDFMPDLYRSLNQADPDLQIRLTRNTIRKNHEALRNDDIDMLIEIHFPNADDQAVPNEYLVKPLLHRNAAFIYSVNSPLAKMEHPTPADFEKEPYLIPNKKEDLHLATHGIETLKTLGIHHPRTETVDNLMSLITNIKLGLGYSILAEAAAKYTPGLIAYTLPEYVSMDVVAIWKKSNTQVTALMNKLTESGDLLSH